MIVLQTIRKNIPTKNKFVPFNICFIKALRLPSQEWRYYSLGKKNLAHQACKLLEDIADPILSVSHEDIVKTISILQQITIPVRDAVHAATMLNNNIHHILSTDIHFDNIPQINRIHPG